MAIILIIAIAIIGCTREDFTGKVINNVICDSCDDIFVDVKTFGAKGDGIADDTIALQKAIDKAITVKGVVVFSEGTYLISKGLKIDFEKIDSNGNSNYDTTKVIRISGNGAVIKAITPIDSVIHLNYAIYVSIDNLVLDANKKANHAFTGFKITGRQAIFEKIILKNAISDGFFVEKGQGSIFNSIVAENNGGAGFHCTDCNAAIIQSSIAKNNKGDGFVIDNKDYFGNMILKEIISEKNKGKGAFFPLNLKGTVVRDSMIRDNEQEGILINGRNIVIENTKVISGSKQAIALGKYSFGNKILNNKLSKLPLDESKENYIRDNEIAD